MSLLAGLCTLGHVPHVKQNKGPEVAETQINSWSLLVSHKIKVNVSPLGFIYIYSMVKTSLKVVIAIISCVTMWRELAPSLTFHLLIFVSLAVLSSLSLSLSVLLSTSPFQEVLWFFLPSSHSACFSWCNSSLRRSWIALLSPLLCCHGNKEMK